MSRIYWKLLQSFVSTHIILFALNLARDLAFEQAFYREIENWSANTVYKTTREQISNKWLHTSI